jgi:hypothetical protein
LYTMKTEIVLYDLKQSVYWQSIIEVSIMLCAFIALLTSHSLLFFMHCIHIVRPYFAVKIIARLPKTHEILETLSDDLNKAQTEASQYMIDQFRTASVYYSYYFIVSAIAAVFDVLALFYTVANLGGTNNAYVFYLNAAMVFIFFDFYILFWANSLAFTFPKSLCETSTVIANNSVKDTTDLVNGVFSKLGKK